MSTTSFILYLDFISMCVVVVATLVSAIWGRGHSMAFRVNIFVFAVAMAFKAYERSTGSPVTSIDMTRDVSFLLIAVHYMKISLQKRGSE